MVVVECIWVEVDPAVATWVAVDSAVATWVAVGSAAATWVACPRDTWVAARCTKAVLAGIRWEACRVHQCTAAACTWVRARRSDREVWGRPVWEWGPVAPQARSCQITVPWGIPADCDPRTCLISAGLESGAESAALEVRSWVIMATPGILAEREFRRQTEFAVQGSAIPREVPS